VTRIVVGLLAVALAVPAAVQEREVPLLPPGLHTRTLVRDPAPAVQYAIQVPRGLRPGVHAPLVLALHYGGEPFDSSGRGVIELLVGPALADLGAVIVAPDALVSGWDAPVNEAAALDLLDRVARRYDTDPARVVVTGFSMGGAGTWHFASAHPERFSAALPVAGRPPASEGNWRVPVFAVGSRRDAVVPIGPTVERIAELKAKGLTAEMVILETPTHYQTAAHADGLSRAVSWLKALWAH